MSHERIPVSASEVDHISCTHVKDREHRIWGPVSVKRDLLQTSEFRTKDDLHHLHFATSTPGEVSPRLCHIVVASKASHQQVAGLSVVCIVLAMQVLFRTALPKQKGIVSPYLGGRAGGVSEMVMRWTYEGEGLKVE